MAESGWVTRCIAAILILLPLFAQAGVVHFPLPSGPLVSAQYQSGRPDYPAVLLLHGFLQTRDAPPMSSLGQALADAGYTVLMPTLSLGYSQRNQSLACEAMHKHTLQDDTAELAFWVNWLNKNSKRPIVLIGHSNGSAVIMHYIAQHPARNIQGAILASIVPMKVDAVEYQHARKDKTASAQSGLHKYRLSYCQYSYLSTATGYLSYAALDEHRVLAELHQAKVPLHLIVGGADQVFAAGWEKRLVTAFPSTIVIPGSGHFFEDGYEFSLLDQVQAILSKWRGQPG